MLFRSVFIWGFDEIIYFQIESYAFHTLYSTRKHKEDKYANFFSFMSIAEYIFWYLKKSWEYFYVFGWIGIRLSRVDGI